MIRAIATAISIGAIAVSLPAPGQSQPLPAMETFFSAASEKLHTNSEAPPALKNLREQLSNLRSGKLDSDTEAETIVGELIIATGDGSLYELGQAALRERKQFREAQAKLLAEAKAAGDTAAWALARAEKPADLDAAIAGLVRVCPKKSVARSPVDTPLAVERARSLLAVLEHWQNMLCAIEVKDFAVARVSLRHLESEKFEDSSPAPRSEIVSKLKRIKAGLPPEGTVSPEARRDAPARKFAQERAEAIRDFLEIPRALEEIHKNARAIGEFGYTPVQLELENLWSFFKSCESGVVQQRYPRYLEPLSGVEPNAPAERLRRQMWAHLLPRVTLDLSPAEKEVVSVIAPLKDAWQKAFTGGDWARAERTLNVGHALGLDLLADAAQERALRFVLAAKNFEEAGQFTFAAAYYSGALSTGASALPAKVIGAKLDALRQEHPEEWAAGTRMLEQALGK